MTYPTSLRRAHYGRIQFQSFPSFFLPDLKFKELYAANSRDRRSAADVQTLERKIDFLTLQFQQVFGEQNSVKKVTDIQVRHFVSHNQMGELMNFAFSHTRISGDCPSGRGRPSLRLSPPTKAGVRLRSTSTSCPYPRITRSGWCRCCTSYFTSRSLKWSTFHRTGEFRSLSFS